MHLTCTALHDLASDETLTGKFNKLNIDSMNNKTQTGTLAATVLKQVSAAFNSACICGCTCCSQHFAPRVADHYCQDRKPSVIKAPQFASSAWYYLRCSGVMRNTIHLSHQIGNLLLQLI